VDQELQLGAVDDFKENGVLVAVGFAGLPLDLESDFRVLFNRQLHVVNAQLLGHYIQFDLQATQNPKA